MPEPNALEPLRRSTRNALLVTLVLVGALTPLALINTKPGPVRAAVLIAGTVIFLWVYGRRLWRTVMSGRWEAIPLWRTWALVAFVMALSLLGLTVDPQLGLMSTTCTGLALAEFVIGRGSVAWWFITAGAIAQGLAFGVSAGLSGSLLFAFVSTTVMAAFVLLTAYCLAISFRQWEGALKLDRARREAADLATVRERLRLAEDLHDILGHALEVVSLKSELAVRLGPIDPDRAQAEMVEVQALARGALKDVRALVQDNRPTDLGTELVGARKLLTSAGIECDFDADDTLVTQRELFGRVLREAVTNLLRHANARTCCVSLTVGRREAVLRVRNDGVQSASVTTTGSGLAGLARRVNEAGGTFQAGAVEPESFEVVAKVPA
ncbi:sensor histidine kinase [Actinocrispum wychmicini]|uniref:Two-component system sensor histidine kinase DesK n=1 Tax=Actinocrispum wychmicini TaxID=1213861 RepID=A0A4V2S8W1_9PSEU|nr:histidine kinase [Actinocrispum wychmicini]TCO65330.1 two-component system sensor histidine kinase DesK [Actinocrispum wychmicini]